jgi:hypothetical protein
MAIDLNKEAPPQLRLFGKPTALDVRAQIPLWWKLSEGLLSKDVQTKKETLAELDRLEIIFTTPILASILSNLLHDIDLEVRSMAINLAVKLLDDDQRSGLSDDRARTYLSQELSRMRTRPIYALIQLYNSRHLINEKIVRLIEFCPNAGKHLVDIASNRKFPLDIRQNALDILGIIGYLDAIPDLERLLSRLVTRLNGQKAMPFVSTTGLDETPLLPNLDNALTNLKAL